MSNEDFQARLRRIGAKHEAPVIAMAGDTRVSARAASPRDKRSNRPDFPRLVIGATVLAFGILTARLTNRHYETLRDEAGLPVVALIAVAAIALLLFGGGLILRAALRKPAAPADERREDSLADAPRRTASALARTGWSLLGLTMGVTGGVYMFLAAGARFIPTETARQFVIGATLIFLLLLLISLIFAILAIFLRGRALARVPACFVIGTLLTVGVFRYFHLNVLNWTQFTGMLQ